MRFLLVTSLNKNLVKLWACQETSHIGSLLPPVDLCSIAAVLREQGHDVMIVDPRLYRKPLQAYISRLESFKPDAIVLNITTTSACSDYEIIKYIPPGIKKIAFGTHALAMPEDCIKNGVDCILSGDPETSIQTLIKNNFTISAFQEATNKSAGSRFGAPEYAQDLDDLPYPALDLIDIQKYHTLYVKSKRFSVLLGSRGCHYVCTYCLMPQLFGRRIRLRSVENIVDEIQFDYEKHAINEFMFLDATFNSSEERVLALCEEIIKRDFKHLRWSCNMRVSPVSDLLLQMMKRAGCNRIYYGVEDVDVLEEIKKNITRDDIIRAFHGTKKHGIRTVAFIMLFPKENKDESRYASEIVTFLMEIKADTVQCNVAIPFPGTQMYRKLQDNLSTDWSCYDPNSVKLPYKSSIDLIGVKKKVYLNFAFLSPRVLFTTVFDSNKKDLTGVIGKFCAMIKDRILKLK